MGERFSLLEMPAGSRPFTDEPVNPAARGVCQTYSPRVLAPLLHLQIALGKEQCRLEFPSAFSVSRGIVESTRKGIHVPSGLSQRNGGFEDCKRLSYPSKSAELSATPDLSSGQRALVACRPRQVGGASSGCQTLFVPSNRTQ